MEKRSEKEVDELIESCEEIELKRRRKKEREASRLDLDHLSSVDFDDNLEAVKEIGLLCGWSSPYHYYVNVGDQNTILSRIGLSLKHEFCHEDDEEEEEEEDKVEKVIFCGDTNMEKCNDRVAVLKSRFVDVISKSQQEFGLLDHKSTRDFKKHVQQQPLQPMIKVNRSFKRTVNINECKTKSATIKEQDHLKEKLMVIKVVDGGFRKPRRQSILATIKASFYRSQRHCYDMLH